MKSISIICALLISAVSFAQEETISYSAKNSNHYNTSHSEEKPERNLQVVQAEIKSIEAKMNQVKADPKLLEEAKASGWYDQYSTKLMILQREKQFYEELEKNNGVIKTYTKEEFNSLPKSKQDIILSNPDKYKVEK